MKRIIGKGLALLAVAALFAIPVARAACSFDTQQVVTAFGGFIDSCPDDNPIQGNIYSIANPNGVNSNGNGFVCRFDGEDLAQSPVQACIFGGAGVIGDDAVTILEEFGIGTNTLGCPSPSQGSASPDPVAITLTCNNGAGIIIVVGIDPILQTYLVENASPNGFSFSANFDNGPAISSQGAGPSPSAVNICVNVPVPHVFSDCAMAASSCPNPAALPTLNRGALVTRTGPCGGSVDSRLRSCAGTRASCTTDANCGGAVGSCVADWTPLPTQPDAAGDACNIIDQPTVDGQCAFVGTTGQWTGGQLPGPVNTETVIGWFQVNPFGAATDKVKIDRAGFEGGKLVVAFSTSNETSIVGFNVYSGSLKLNGSLISAKGTGSNPYSFEVGRGALKGGKTVLVEAVKSDNSVEKTAPVSLK